MARGFVYLAAVVDWFSRRVLSWRLSITMEVGFCIEALEEAIARHGRPEIFNTDQGSQFTSQGFTGVLNQAGIAISMDGKGSWRDNVFVERLWRSIKYEEIYLGGSQASIDRSSSIPRSSAKRAKSAIEASTMRTARETTQVRRRNRASQCRWREWSRSMPCVSSLPTNSRPCGISSA